jgi:anti-sigma factor RsiW
VSSGRWRISVTTPDWGHDHLSSDAIVAYVDDELAAGPHLRATRHLSQCPECAAQVVAQGQARAALRTAGCPSLPSSLLSSLRSIPQDTDLPAPPAGLAVTPDGQFVSVLRPERAAHEGIGPERGAPRADLDASAAHGDRSHRRMWLGTGVAVSGLAVGAIAFAVPAAG